MGKQCLPRDLVPPHRVQLRSLRFVGRSILAPKQPHGIGPSTRRGNGPPLVRGCALSWENILPPLEPFRSSGADLWFYSAAIPISLPKPARRMQCRNSSAICLPSLSSVRCRRKYRAPSRCAVNRDCPGRTRLRRCRSSKASPTRPGRLGMGGCECRRGQRRTH